MVKRQKAASTLLCKGIILTLEVSGCPKITGKDEGGPEQPRSGLPVGESRSQRSIRTPVLQSFLSLSSCTPKPSASICTTTDIRKSEIWSDFPSHWNKGQTPKVNNEATLMGKVECCSEPENPKIKQSSAGASGKQSSQRSQKSL